MNRAEVSRQNILRSAYLFMVEKGTIPTMREIAGKADMGLGSVYYHFSSQDQIFMELDNLSYDHIKGVIQERIAQKEDPLLLFMSVETMRSLFYLSREIYVTLFQSLPMGINFSESRIRRLEEILDPLWERSDDYDVYHYQGLYTAFMAKVLSSERVGHIYDGMERLFFSFFQDSLDLWKLSDTFSQVKELGKLIPRRELSLPWINSEKSISRKEFDSRSIGSFD